MVTVPELRTHRSGRCDTARVSEPSDVPVPGIVREWHPGDGWGVIDTDAAPGGCWAHYSCVLVEGYRSLEAGAEVELTIEQVRQDGYDYRAVEVWPAGAIPVRTPVETGPSAAYTSSLSLTFDDDRDPDH